MNNNRSLQLKKPPSKLTKKEKEYKEQLRMTQSKLRVLAALKKSLGIVTAACEETGISRRTFYEYLKHDEEFKQKVEDVQDIVLDITESKLYQNVAEGKEASIFFHLKCKGKRRGFIEQTTLINDHKGLPQKMVIGGQEIDFS